MRGGRDMFAGDQQEVRSANQGPSLFRWPHQVIGRDFESRVQPPHHAHRQRSVAWDLPRSQSQRSLVFGLRANRFHVHGSVANTSGIYRADLRVPAYKFDVRTANPVVRRDVVPIVADLDVENHATVLQDARTGGAATLCLLDGRRCRERTDSRRTSLGVNAVEG